MTAKELSLNELETKLAAGATLQLDVEGARCWARAVAGEDDAYYVVRDYGNGQRQPQSAIGIEVLFYIMRQLAPEIPLSSWTVQE